MEDLDLDLDLDLVLDLVLELVLQRSYAAVWIVCFADSDWIANLIISRTLLDIVLMPIKILVISSVMFASELAASARSARRMYSI